MNRALLLALLAATGCANSAQTSASTDAPAADAPKAIAVKTAVVESKEVPRTILLTGSLLANQEARVAANANGRVLQTLVERGDRVTKGQALFRLDSLGTSLLAQASEAQAALAEVQRLQSERDCARAEVLHGEGAMSDAEYERTRTQCEAQRRSHDAAKANAAVAAKNFGDTVIRAPFAGVIGERLVSEGEYVQPPTAVATLVAADPVRLVITVPERAAGRVRQGQEITFTVVESETSFVARIDRVAPSLSTATRELTVESLVPNPDGRLVPGTFATAKLEIGRESHPVVPDAALRQLNGATRVFTVKDDVALEHVVRLGPSDNGVTAVLTEIQPGDVIVVEPPANLRDGAKVGG